MRKITVLFFIVFGFINTIKAQLEVNDTLLLAFNNDIFWGASSELEMGMYADFGKYGSTNLGDDNSTTCWAEGSEKDGIGEYILLSIPEKIQNIKIKNGYQKNENLYYANNRPKTIELSLYASYEPSGYVTESHNGFFISESLATTQFELEDKLGYQNIKTGFDWERILEELDHDNTFDKDRFVLKIKILNVYKGNKWNDACISDIKVIPNPYFDLTIDEHGLLKITGGDTDTLFYNTENIYQVVEISSYAEWIIFIIMPSDIEDSRVETIYELYNTKKEKFIEINDIYEMYGFVKKSGKLFLEGTDKDFNDYSICLDDL